jgi:hypothetical protein
MVYLQLSGVNLYCRLHYIFDQIEVRPIKSTSYFWIDAHETTLRLWVYRSCVSLFAPAYKDSSNGNVQEVAQV